MTTIPTSTIAMTTSSASAHGSGPRALARILSQASRAALQWRLLLLWTVCQWLPTAIIALPVWQLFGTIFDHSVRAGALAQRLDLLSLPELIAAVQRNGLAFGTASIVALLVSVLLAPWQSALVIAAARAPAPLRFAALWAGAAAWYGRMLRMLIWAIVPLGAALAFGAAAIRAAGNHNDGVFLQSDTVAANALAIAAATLLLFVAGATLDAGRAALAVDESRSSVIKAWWSGLSLLVRRPLPAFGAYGLLSVAGLLLAAALGVLRLNVPDADTAGAIAAFVVTQLIVVALAWMRSARLFALVTATEALRAQASRPGSAIKSTNVRTLEDR